MQLVVLARWGAPLEAELPVLAGLLKVVAYDLRMRIAGTPPVVVASFPDAPQADALAATLRARGHGIVVHDTARAGDVPSVVREFEFGDRALRGRDDLTRNFELPYAEIAALIRAAQISTLDSTVTTVEKKLNVGRALMTGGLMMNKKVEKTTHSASEEREQVLYAFPRGTHTPLVFRESVLRYQGLGPHLKSVTAQNFATLIELLRERAPHALYDQRMLTQKRKVGVTSFAGLATDRRVESSNASENELAATLIVLAHEQGQL